MPVNNSNMQWSIICTGDKTVDKVTLDAYLYGEDDIEVILRTIADGSESVLVKTTDYTISSLPSAAAVITTVSDYSSAYELHVRRVTDLKQTVAFPEGDPFPNAVVAKVMDKQTMDQQVTNDAARRGVMVAKTSALRDLKVTPEASKVFGMNADNDAVIMYAPTASADADLADLIGAGFGIAIYPKSIQVGSANIKVLSGAGTPEANVIASVGSVYLRTDGAADTSIYFKETGAGNTGWVARDTFNSIAAATGVFSGALQAASIQTNGTALKTKVIEIGDWDMDATNSVNVAHGLTASKIRNIAGLIRNDVDTEYYIIGTDHLSGDLSALTWGSYSSLIPAFDATNIRLVRGAGKYFDSINFDSLSYNRGWITITYEA